MSAQPCPPQEGLLVVRRRGPWASGASGFALADAPATELSSAMQKLGAPARAEAVRVAEDKGWL